MLLGRILQKNIEEREEQRIDLKEKRYLSEGYHTCFLATLFLFFSSLRWEYLGHVGRGSGCVVSFSPYPLPISYYRYQSDIYLLLLLLSLDYLGFVSLAYIFLLPPSMLYCVMWSSFFRSFVDRYWFLFQQNSYVIETTEHQNSTIKLLSRE